MKALGDRAQGAADFKLADKLKTEPYWFVREALGNHQIFPEKLEGDFERLFKFVWAFGAEVSSAHVNSPRNSYKTTLVACRCAHLICLDRNIRILYFTNTFKNATRFSGGIRRALQENQTLLRAFGRFKPDQRVDGVETSWAESQFFVSGRSKNITEPTLTVAGVGVDKTGNHYDIIVTDDVVDMDSSNTGEALKATIEWYRGLTPLLDKKSKYGPGGCQLNLGTRYADADLHGWLLGETDDESAPVDEYETLVLRSMNNPEKAWDKGKRRFVGADLNFPFVLTEALLTRDRRKQGTAWFYSQYQNECIPPETAIFRKEQFKLIPPRQVPQGLLFYVFTDYAYSQADDADRTAIWVVGLDWKRRAYCVDFDLGRWKLDERIWRTVRYAQHYNAVAISVEDITGNDGVIGGLERLVDQRRLRCRIEKIRRPSKISKEMRIRALQPRFENGLIFFVTRDLLDSMGIKPEFIRLTKQGTVVGPIVDEFVRFPKAPHDDIPDALADVEYRDRKTRLPLFTGSSRMPEQRPIVGELINGRIQSLPIVAQPQGRGGDFWADCAHRMRGNYGRFPGR